MFQTLYQANYLVQKRKYILKVAYLVLKAKEYLFYFYQYYLLH